MAAPGSQGGLRPPGGHSCGAGGILPGQRSPREIKAGDVLGAGGAGEGPSAPRKKDTRVLLGSPPTMSPNPAEWVSQQGYLGDARSQGPASVLGLP